MGKRKSTAEDRAGEMDVDGDSSDDVSQIIKNHLTYGHISKNQLLTDLSRTHP